jgi:hypothetical protein
MILSRVLEKHNVLQQYKNWYVLDEQFSWNLDTLYHAIFRHLSSRYQVPVIFCSIREANKIISELGDEEEEYLRFASAIYWRESRIIFIFDYDEYIPLIKNLFHEFRHVMQDLNPDFRHHFDSDRKLPYKERITEMDAFQFADEKATEYLQLQLLIDSLHSPLLLLNIWTESVTRYNLNKHLSTIWKSLLRPLLPNL